jgi:hypothetical protein
MSPLLLWSLICVVLFLLTAGLVLAGILKQKVNYIIVATVMFLLLVGCGVYTGFLFAGRAVQKVTHLLTPRSGYMAYTALFGEPIDSSVKVLSLQDQYVPRLDVAIRMEVVASSKEFRRIILQQDYTKSAYNAASQPRASDAQPWFMPERLKGQVFVYSSQPSADGDVQHIYASEDSTHFFVEDIAD